MTPSRPKILFFAEGATLAHVARPFVLARDLDPSRFDVTFARPPAFTWLTADALPRVVDLWSQDPAVFARRLAHGLPLYDYPTLLRYVQDDLALIDAVKPDVIVGDFRLSLSVSARLRAIPYITICDVYWSPELPLQPPLPVLSFTRFTPIPVADFAFRCVSGLALRLHTIPIERLRKHYGLPSLGFNLQRSYTDADLRLFANFPALFPNTQSTPNSAFIGPISWSPAPKGELDDLLTGTDPLVYVTMGSSGDPDTLATLIPILTKYASRILIASAGKPMPPSISESPNIRIFDYVPGDRACQQSMFVICNGGSPTTYQALANGVPVLGIPKNMDQFLNMQAIVRFGAGVMIRGDRANAMRFKNVIETLTSDRRFTEQALRLAAQAPKRSIGTIFAVHLDRLIRASHR